MSYNKEKVVGKNTIHIPALKLSRFHTTCEFDASPECRASPSPCSSTTLSFLSTTSDEYVLPSESAFEETKRRNVKWKNPDALNDFSHLKTSDKDFVSSKNITMKSIQTSDFVTDSSAGNKAYTELIHGYGTPSDVKISSFSGIKLCPQMHRAGDDTRHKSNDDKEVIDYSRAPDLNQVFSASNLKHNMDNTYVMTKPIQGDFVSISDTRTLTPPPDFIDDPSTSKSSDAVTLSCQPNLDVMLSGAVRSSALLTKKSDFVPAALMPREMLRAKSKSLSDLSKREKKTKRFLDRRKVIKMNLEDKDCCSHTEVTPSSMMTLAAELLVSKNSKAARLFREARRKADGQDSQQESILPRLWVVPKSSSTDNDERKTASHLKPLVRNENIPQKEENEDVKKTELHAVNLRGTKNQESIDIKKTLSKLSSTSGTDRLVEPCGDITRNAYTNEIAQQEQKSGTYGTKNETIFKTEPPTVTLRGTKGRRKTGKTPSKYSCIPLSEQIVENYGKFTGDREQIDSKDVQQDLMTLTVADLVGTPDTVYTDTESEFDERDCFQPRWKDFSTNKKKREKFSKCTSSPKIKKDIKEEYSKTGSVNETTLATCSIENQQQPLENTELSKAINVCKKSKETTGSKSHLSLFSLHGSVNETTPKAVTSGIEMQYRPLENTEISEATSMCVNSRETKDSKSDRSSFSSNSSLTTVSSLSLSSSSLGSPDHPPKDSIQTLAKASDLKLREKVGHGENNENVAGKVTSSIKYDEQLNSKGAPINDIQAKDVCTLRTKMSTADEYDKSRTIPEVLVHDYSEKVEDHSYMKNKNLSQKSHPVKNRVEKLIPDFGNDVIKEIHDGDGIKSISKAQICATTEYKAFVPKVPVRTNSIKVMDTLRKRHKKIIKAKAERAKLSQNIQQETTAASESCDEWQQPFPGDDSKHLSLNKNALSQVTPEGASGSLKKANCLRATTQLKRSDENHKQLEVIRDPSSLLISTEGNQPKTELLNKARDHSLGYSPKHIRNEIIDDAYCSARKDKVKTLQTAQSEYWYGDTKGCLSSTCATEDCWDDRRTVVKDIQQLLDMPTETFRNGEISVVDGSRIALTNQVSSVQSSDKYSSSLYLSDLLGSQRNSDPKNNEEIVESILLPTAAAQLQSTYIQSKFEEDHLGKDTSIHCEAELSPGIKAEIVRKTDLENYFPEYQSVIVTDSDKMKSDSMSHNICAKPFSRNVELHHSNHNTLTSRHTKSLQNMYPDTAGTKSTEDTYSKSGNAINAGYGSSFNDDLVKKNISEVSAASSSSVTNMFTSQSNKEEEKNSAYKLLTGGKNVYSSCVKITLCPNQSETMTEKNVDEMDSRLDFGRINMVMKRPNVNAHPKVEHSHRRKSFPIKNDRVRNNSRNVREVKTPEMKSTESFEIQSDLPAHSQVDEGDFAGVVDGPTKNVREIRAMFKNGPDYADYAKPKLVQKKKSAQQMRTKSPTLPTSRPQSTEVAQQILGLFKGALTLEVDGEQTNTQENPTTVIQNGETNKTHEEEPISLKDKVASFNVGKSPVKENEVNNNISNDDVIITKCHQKSEEKMPCVEIITNPTPTTNGDSKKAVQQEKVSADSYDESLDQFYDILDELSST